MLSNKITKNPRKNGKMKLLCLPSKEANNMLTKKIINYLSNSYSCDSIINNFRFTELVISQYYKSKPERRKITDELIRELVKQLSNDKVKELIRSKNGYFSFEPLHIGYRAYNLVLDFDDKPFSNPLLVIDCYREKSLDLPRKNINK